MKQNKLTTLTKVLFSSLILLFTVTSCSSDDGGTKKEKDEEGGGGKDKVKTLVLEALGELRVLENTTIAFKVTGDGNTLADAMLYIDDQAITENTYTFTTEGSYAVMAKKEGYKDSNTVTIKVFKDEVPVVPIGELKYQHRILMEDFTGVQCGPCASAIRAFEKLENHTYSGNGFPVNYSNIVVVGIHLSIPGYDPFTISRFAHPQFDYYNAKVVNDPERQGRRWNPFIVINGKVEWDTRTMSSVAGQNHPMTLVEKTSAIGIKINSGFSSTGGYAEAEIAFSQDYDGLTMDYFIVEDDVKHAQAGIGPNYLHQAVLKAATPAITGISIPSAQSKKGNIFAAKPFSAAYKLADESNLRVIVAVRDAQGNVLNVQDAKANTTKDFVIID